MAKKKSIKNKSKKNKKMGLNVAGESYSAFKIAVILFVIVVVIAGFYLLTVFIVGKGETADENKETAIQYEEILAGASFSMRPKEYLVVYYDKSDTKLNDISSGILNYKFSTAADTLNIYSVDMSSGFNKRYVAEESNKKPASTADLAINGPTLIKISDGKVAEYVEGLDAVVEYLK